MPPPNVPPDVYAFQIDLSLVSWDVPPRQWVTGHDKHWTGLAVGSVVFDDAGCMLLVQRAAHNSMPNRWEIPGGDAGGGSILRRGSSCGDDHLGYIFNNRTGTQTLCKFTFKAQVKSCTPVVLDPDEHQDHVWANKDEVREERIVDGRAILITTAAQKAVLLEAFRLHRQ